MSSTSTTSTTRPRRRRALVGAAGAVAAAGLVLAAPVAASAHVHVTPSSTEAGATAMLTVAYSHGCDGSPTNRVEVSIPEEVAAVALIANAGWQVEAQVDGGARTVVFTTDEPTPDGVRESLELEVELPEDAAEGTVLAFPTVQGCVDGETAWTDPDPASDAPAPSITIGAAADGHGGDGSTHGSEDADAAAAEEAPAEAPAEEAPADSATPLAIAALVVAGIAALLAAIGLRRRAQP